jgi:hypothetical protein
MLGFLEKTKPPQLVARGGCWFESGAVTVHLGVDKNFIPARKAHPAFIVDDLAALETRLKGAGYKVTEDEPIEGSIRQPDRADRAALKDKARFAARGQPCLLLLRSVTALPLRSSRPEAPSTQGERNKASAVTLLFDQRSSVMTDAVIHTLGFLGLVVGLGGLGATAYTRLRDRGFAADSFKPISEWKPTGHIDFFSPQDDVDISQTRSGKQGSFVLRVEDYRIVESPNIGGGKRLEYRWRKATLAEAKDVASMHNGNIVSADSYVAPSIRSPALVPASTPALRANGDATRIPALDQSEEASTMTAH